MSLAGGTAPGLEGPGPGETGLGSRGVCTVRFNASMGNGYMGTPSKANLFEMVIK